MTHLSYGITNNQIVNEEKHDNYSLSITVLLLQGIDLGDDEDLLNKTWRIPGKNIKQKEMTILITIMANRMLFYLFLFKCF